MSIAYLSLHELLPLSITSTPSVSIREENKVWIATTILVHHLEFFSDSLVVTDKENKPIDVMGGIEIVKSIFENPNSQLFDNISYGERCR